MQVDLFDLRLCSDLDEDDPQPGWFITRRDPARQDHIPLSGAFHAPRRRVTLADDMPDDDDKLPPIPFTIDVTVDRTRVQVTLLLAPGTAVKVKETKATTEPQLPRKEQTA